MYNTRCVSPSNRVGFLKNRFSSRLRARRDCACASGTFTTCHTVLYFTWGKREFSSTCVNAAAEWWLTVSGDKRKTRQRFFPPPPLLFAKGVAITDGCHHEAENIS